MDVKEIYLQYMIIKKLKYILKPKSSQYYLWNKKNYYHLWSSKIMIYYYWLWIIDTADYGK